LNPKKGNTPRKEEQKGRREQLTLFRTIPGQRPREVFEWPETQLGMRPKKPERDLHREEGAKTIQKRNLKLKEGETWRGSDCIR